MQYTTIDKSEMTVHELKNAIIDIETSLNKKEKQTKLELTNGMIFRIDNTKHQEFIKEYKSRFMTNIM